jgi:putative ABC transport system permease protein
MQRHFYLLDMTAFRPSPPVFFGLLKNKCAGITAKQTLTLAILSFDSGGNMETLWQDLRFSLRILAKRPGFTFIVVLTLALGIGATTAIFSLIYGILLRPFPYREPDRLARIQTVFAKPGGATRGSSLRDVEDWRKLNRTLDDLGAYTTFDSDLRGDGLAEPIRLTQLNPGALSILGVQPIVGRLFLSEEDLQGSDVHKALIGYDLWQRRFGADPNIVGKSLRTGIVTLTIVGVMPPGFRFPENTDVWTPMESWYALTNRSKNRDIRPYPVIARLRPGVTLDQAQADLNGVAAALEQQYPKENESVRVKFSTLRDAEVGNIRPYLLLLIAAVGFVLLICCVNVANLMLAQAAARQREFSVRAALGASRPRLARALLMDSLLLALLGGAAGIALAYQAVKALLALIPVTLPFWMKIEVDAPVLLFSLAVAVLTSVLFGLAPAWQASRVNLSDALKEGARGSSAHARARSTLVVAQMALCLLLLVGAGLMMQSFLRLLHVKTGFMPEGLLVARVTNFKTGARAETAAAMAVLHEQTLTRLRALPGALSAGVTGSLPFTSAQTERSRVDLRIKGRAEEELKYSESVAGADVSPGLLDTLGVPLRAGRLFDARDVTESPMVVIINERAAKKLFPDRDPIGQELLWGAPTPQNPYCRIIGVVGDVKHRAAEGGEGVELYYPYSQWPVTNGYYVLRTQGDPQALATAMRQAINAVNKDAAIVYLKPMEQLIGESLWQRRLWGVLFAVFAFVALSLAAVGLYGVMSYLVSQRTREIGVRMALGAQTGDVLRMALAQGVKLALGGIALGLAGALGLVSLISGLLYGVTARDPLTFAGVALLLLLVALLACWIPARRATKVDPLVALRCE